MQTTVVRETAIGARKYHYATVIAAMFVAWRLYLSLFGALGLMLDPEQTRPPLETPAIVDTDGPGISPGDALVRAWTRWDGEHYLFIATKGYKPDLEGQPNIAFFPLYPLLMVGLGRVFGGGVFANAIAGILISNAALFGALLVLFRLVERDFSRALAFRTVAVLLLFPVSFYFGVVYSESLALLLGVGGFWFIRRERWWLAGACGFLLALTRMPGVLFAPLLAIVYFQACGWNIRKVRWPMLAAGLPVLGLCAFMAYQWATFGTPVAFLEAQRAWNQRLSPPWVLVQSTLDRLVNGQDFWQYWLLYLGAWLLFLVLGLLSVRRLPLVYNVAFWALTLPAFLNNKLVSFPRYMLLGFPAFILLAHLLQSRRSMLLYTAMGALLSIISVVLYVNFMWVS